MSSIWTGLMIILNLDNVTLELNSLPEEVDGRESRREINGTQIPLACVNFIRSKLTYESFSDESKDVDLVSEEILISDTRFKGKQDETSDSCIYDCSTAYLCVS